MRIEELFEINIRNKLANFLNFNCIYKTDLTRYNYKYAIFCLLKFKYDLINIFLMTSARIVNYTINFIPKTMSWLTSCAYIFEFTNAVHSIELENPCWLRYDLDVNFVFMARNHGDMHDLFYFFSNLHISHWNMASTVNIKLYNAMLS
jgi:hypothetical protein